jgi:hypothetical protein
MSLTWKKTAGIDTGSTIKAARQTRAASSAAAVNAAGAAQNAALTAQNAAGAAAAAATSAAQTASDAAQTAAAGLSKGVKQGVYTARSWAAPRLDVAAEYCTTTVAPRVSSALHNTARQVSPPDTKPKRSSVLTWSLLGAAVLAALGAAAAVARLRYRSAIAADSEAVDEEVVVERVTAETMPGTADGSKPATGKPEDQDTETSVNGQVTASGW